MAALFEDLIGKRFMLVGNHPFKGYAGKIVRIGETALGKRPIMKLDGVVHGISGYECYVIRSKQVAKITKKKKVKEVEKDEIDRYQYKRL